jgi:transcription-repair coupling factor (superfamily II helicase)
MEKQEVINSILSNLQSAVDGGQNVSVFGLSFGEKALFLCKQKRPIVFVTNSVAQSLKLAQNMQAFGKTTKSIIGYPSDYFSMGSNTYGEGITNSLDALFSLCKNNVDCLVISPNVLMQKFAKVETYSQSMVSLNCGQNYNVNELIQSLVNIGYNRTQTVQNRGEFSVFGDTITVFDFISQNPLKLEFFDDELEDIFYIDISSFKKLGSAKKASISPSSTFLFDVNDKEEVLKKITSNFESTLKTLGPNEAIKLKTNFEEFKVNFDANNFNYIKNWLFPFAKFDSITKYFAKDTIVVFDDVKQIVDCVKTEYLQFENSLKLVKQTGDALDGFCDYYIPESQVFDIGQQMLSFQQITTQNRIFSPQFVDSYKASAETNYLGNYDLLSEDLSYYLEYKNTVVVCTGSSTLTAYLQKFLQSKGVDAIANPNQIQSKKVNLIDFNLPYGAIFVEDKFVVIGTNELKKQTEAKKPATENKKEEFTLPKIGDYVVHETFGIGLCVGIEKKKFTDYQKDYIILQYENGDKLYLPTEQIGQISAYVSNGKAPKLNKLGTHDFEKTKTKVKSSLKQLAFNLVELYKQRENAKGFKFEVDKKLLDEFNNSFPYDETPDQLTAINHIVADMTSGKVMDRIVCGDVGYGKTEVALRTAFVCAINGKQTAFLAPTTVLSQQHFNNAKQRLNNFGITIECLNRFKTKAQQADIIKRLKNGEIDVICGTHRLLSSDVGFKDLGLLILDEEQRFGVADKEKIKRLKTNVDVLTLSATPIPRTLHMGLVGIRDIDIIATPPAGRLPVQTTVTEYSDSLVLQAINRELSRGGQVLIVYNRVETIYAFASHIRSLLDNQVQIGVAHGQMDSKQLETQILDLYNKKTQILISTTLIENGIDLPSANTLIIIDADKLGLSQLYQLKGRVGRSKNLGYAYFTFDKDKSLSEDAYKRLNAIMEFTELGSGFKIAMKDLEIRGCGNILGAEQSGHMAKVGYDMYCKILNEAVSEIKGQKQREYKDIKLDVALNCYIPENYILGEDSRFRVYSNLKQINSSQSKQKVLAEIEDLFGKVPDEILNLANVAMLKNLAQEFNVKRISITRERCLAEFYDKENMLSKNIALALKQNDVKVFYSQIGAITNFMLSEYSVKRKLEILCSIFQDAVVLQDKNKK